jgi:two-component system, sensor histidine kinase and response regulator
MNDALLNVVRQRQGLIADELAERLPPSAPHLSTPLGRPPRFACDRLVTALADCLLDDDDAAARAWAASVSSVAAEQGWRCGDVLADIDTLAGIIRGHLVAAFPGGDALLEALAALDGGLAVLRRLLADGWSAGAPASLADERRILEALVEHQSDFVCLATLEGKPFYVNPAGRKLLGLSDEQEASNLKLRDFHAEETWNQLRNEAFPAVKREGYWRGEGRVRHQGSGEEIDVMMTWYLVRPAGVARPLCLVGKHRDIRRRLEAERRERESEARKAAILESSLDPIITMDHDGRITEFNRAAEKVFGRKRETVLGQDLAKVLFSSSESAEYQDRIDRYLGAGAGSLLNNRTEVTAVRANGEEFPVEMAMTMGHVQGKPVCTFFLRDISESRRAEKKLRDSEALYHSLVENLPVNVFRKNLQGVFTFGNERYCEMLGKRPDQIIGKTDFDFFPKDLAFKYRDDDRRVIATEETFESIEEHFKPNGEKLYVHVLKTPVRDASGEILGTQCIFWDVTSRIRAEQALRESEQRLQSVLDNTTAVIYLKNKQGQYLLVNRCFEELFHVSSQQIVGQTDHDVFPRELADAFRANDLKVMEAGQPLECEEQAPHEDGLHTYISVKVPLREESGEIYGICGISTDISERIRAEEEIRKISAFLDSIIENLPIMLFVKDARELKFERLNRAGEDLLGCQHEQLIGRSDHDLFPPELAGAFIAKDQEVLRSRTLVDIAEERILTPHGERILHTRKIPILDEKGEPAHLVGISEDITERKRQEAELKSAKEAAEAANRAKSAFLANMSHEIRTPMNGVIGMTDLLLDTRLAPEQREYLTLVRDSAHALLALINDVLDFSKIEAGKLDLDRHTFRLRDLLGDTMKSLALRTLGKRLEMVCHLAADVPDRVLGDEVRLRQIVVNLVGNAIKFTERGEIVLDVEVDSLADDEIGLHFVVTDTGIGIPPEKHQLIFQAFEQADTSTTRRYGGTGLGLSITARLVELMGGRLWVESEPGQGSRFHFTARFGRVIDELAAAEPAEPAALAGMRALVVDDNATNRRLLVELLARWGMRPTAVDGGRAALEALRQAAEAGASFPLVLLDAHMPELDGFSLAEQIQQHPDYAQAAVMMLTSGSRPGDIERCRGLGIGSYLMKPIKQSELFNAILAAVGGQASVADEPPLAPAVRSCRPLDVLVVEDSPVNQKLAVVLLERRGHRVTLANDGRAGVAAFLAGRFDVALMDVQMPEMDGFEATAEIRRHEAERALPRLPIVAMTAHAIKGDRERCLAAGMDFYVSKPIQPDELFAILEQVAGAPAAHASPVNEDNSPRQPAERTQPAAPAHAPSQNGNSLVSEAQVLKRVGGDRVSLRMLVGAFTQECASLLAEMRSALDAADANRLRRAAHTLRGSAGIFACEQVTDAATRLELLAKQGRLDGADELVAELDSLADRLLPELAAISAA